MIKKLNLSDFLSISSIVETPYSFQPTETPMSFGLADFYDTIVQHRGSFVINEVTYSSVIPSSNNIYFFKEATDEETIILFDPIIDIKQKDTGFTVFYYPNTVINILLKESNVKEIKTRTEG